jgi:RNA polymerase sigma factor (sigma-70 family)
VTNARAAWLSRHVLPHEPALRGWLMRRRVPGVEVDDVLQETYARLIMRDDLEGVRDPRAYAYQAAWSVLMTHVRRSKVVSIQTMAHIDQLGLPADDISPETQVADREELQRLAVAIAALPGKIQEVFRLRRVEGLPQKDVAARLGLAESTVEKHMRRGLLLLLERFSRGGITTPGASRTTTEETGPRHAQGDG